MPERLVRFAEGLPGIPEDLLLARDRGEVLFVAGAGVSRSPPSNLPNFKELVVRIYAALDAAMVNHLERADADSRDNWHRYVQGLTPAQQAELRRFVEGEYDVVLGMLERRLDSEPDRSSMVRQATVNILGNVTEPTALHLALMRLGRRFGSGLIVTTNFDRLFEAAARKQRCKVLSYSLSGMPQPSRRPDFAGVIHIHGVVPPRGGQSVDLVLTDQDFGDVYLRRRVAAEFIYDAARIFRIVLVGYSASDPPMRYLLTAIAGDELRFPDLKPRYAFVPSEGADRRSQADWRVRGITPILYSPDDKHAELEKLLSAWASHLPELGQEQKTRKCIGKIVANARSRVSESELALFDYLFRRAAPAERNEMVRFMSARGASPDWLDAVSEIYRQEDRRG
jgi:hypothetical protein